MITPPGDPRANARPAGLTDTIWAGFDLIHRHVWLLLLPIAVDLLMWLGPQLSVAPLVDAWSTHPPVAVADDSVAREMDEVRGELARNGDALKSYNLVSLLALSGIPPFGIPSTRAGVPGLGPIVPMQSEAGAGALILGLLMCGLLLEALYYGLVGHLVRQGGLQPRRFVQRLPALTGSVYALFALACIAIVALTVPLGALLGVMQAASPVLPQLVGPVIVGIMLWAVVYLSFTVAALFVSQVWPPNAMQYSIRVVRNNFWSVVALFGLLVVIGSGFPVIWNQLAMTQGQIGIVIGIVGHSYISTALAAASMTYYKERFERMIASHEGSNAPVAPARS